MDNSTMTQPNTLLLITDISGFTRFIASNDPDEGMAHAQKMLEIILKSNDLGLELCEIEGDAVFFYMRNEMPGPDRLIRQIRRTFRAFQDYILENELHTELGVKFYVHAGNCQMLNIGGRSKIFGIDVISIHRLLKGVSGDLNYLLVTKRAADVLGVELNKAYEGSASYDHIGEVPYFLFNDDFLWVHPGEEPQPLSMLDRMALTFRRMAASMATQTPDRAWIRTVMSV